MTGDSESEARRRRDTGQGATTEPVPGAPSLRPAILAQYDRLLPLCTESLQRSFDPDRNLFSRQLLNGVWTEVDATYPHESYTSSCIALIGLSSAGIELDRLGVNPDRCIDAIIAEAGRTHYAGGIGLALWAGAATAAGPSWQQTIIALGVSSEELLTEVVPTLTSMELAWLTTGLLQHAEATGSSDGRDLARRTVDALIRDRINPATSLAVHAATSASFAHRARANIANFADQIYTVQALAAAHRILDHPTAATIGHRLATRLCEFQGPMGEWWWHYDAKRGHVAQRFAVYSVHQHAMAPMALAELAHATGADSAQDADQDSSNSGRFTYDPSILSSLTWLDHNASGASMVDPGARTIWRSLELPENTVAHLTRGALELLGRPDRSSTDSATMNRAVTMNRETRPYEWAWCLYAQSVLAEHAA